MATERQLAQLRAALAYDEADVRSLTEAFLDVKVAVYTDTLLVLAEEYGYDLADDLDLSDDVLRALRDEARRDAQSVVDTFNHDMDQLLQENAALRRDDLITLYEQWAEARADSRADMVAVTEAYPAHADATMAFFQAAGIEPEFDFGGHGDDDPRCEVCQALADTGPHPLARVLAVGIPHINCRQEWHERDVDPALLPDELRLGANIAGIVGQDPLVHRAGGHTEAASQITGGLLDADSSQPLDGD